MSDLFGDLKLTPMDIARIRKFGEQLVITTHVSGWERERITRWSLGLRINASVVRLMAASRERTSLLTA